MAYEDIREAAPLSTFPDGYIEVSKLTAPTSEEAALIVQYNAALQEGDYATCQQILNNNPNLKNCRISVDAYNTIIDEIKAIEMFYMEQVDTLVTDLAAHTVGIDDSAPSSTNTYSSAKIEKLNNVQTITVPAASWAGSSAPYTQSVAITGYQSSAVTASDKPEIFFNTDSIAVTNAEDYAEQCAYIYNIATGSGVLNLTAYDKPTMDIYIDVKGV